MWVYTLIHVIYGKLSSLAGFSYFSSNAISGSSRSIKTLEIKLRFHKSNILFSSPNASMLCNQGQLWVETVVWEFFCSVRV